METPPIPDRIAPLAWRTPALLWTPLALILALGWPWALLYFDPSLRDFTLLILIAAFVLSLSWLAICWARGRPPKARRFVVEAIVLAAIAVALCAPIVLALSSSLELGVAWPLAVLAMTVSLPAALISGLVFAWTALRQPQRKDDHSAVLGDSAFTSRRQHFS